MSPVKKKSRTASVFAWILSLILLIASGFLLWEAWSIQIFSNIQLIALSVFLVVADILLIWGMFARWKIGWRILMMVLAFCISAGSCLGGYYLSETSDFFTVIGGGTSSSSKEDDGTNEILEDADVLTDKMAMTMTTYAMSETGCSKPSDLSGKVIGLATVLDEEGTAGALDQLHKAGMKDEQALEYQDPYSLVDALYNNTVDAIVLPEEFHGDLLDAANDINKYNALTTFTNIVDQYIYYEPVPEEMKNPADPVSDITQDPFVVLVSGSDSYGNLSAKSRSDVNMLVVVNPKTAQVLLVSLPRDTYMQFSCKKNEDACGPAAGQYDKLTHSGIYGIGTTESSIEDYLGVDINYTARINFSSLINIVDAIGGIDVTVEPGLEVERFYSNGTEGVHEGVNHLDGERALAFARERHAYIDGDNQRVRNQQIVMKALISAMMSPSMIVKYPAFIRALSTAFSTNMPSSQIRDLIRLEVSSFPAWDIQSYALSGNSATRYCAALGREASVTLVDESEVLKAHDLISDVTDGKSVTVPDPVVPGSNSNENETDVDIPVYDDGGFDQVPIEQLPGYYDPYQYPPTVTDPVYNDSYQQPSTIDPGYTEPVNPDPGITDPGLGGTDSTVPDPGTGDEFLPWKPDEGSSLQNDPSGTVSVQNS